MASRDHAHATRAYRATRALPLCHTPPHTPLDPSIPPTHAHLLPVSNTSTLSVGEPLDLLGGSISRHCQLYELPVHPRVELTSSPLASFAGSPAPSSSPPQNAVEPPLPVHLGTARERARREPSHPATTTTPPLYISRARGETKDPYTTCSSRFQGERETERGEEERTRAIDLRIDGPR